MGVGGEVEAWWVDVMQCTEDNFTIMAVDTGECGLCPSISYYGLLPPL